MEEKQPKCSKKNDNSSKTLEDSKDIFDFKECSDTIEDICSKVSQMPSSSRDMGRKDENVGATIDDSSEDEEFSEAKEFNDELQSDPKDVDEDMEYDDVYLKELYDNMSEEQLKQQKETANGIKSSANEQYKSGNYLEAIALYTQALNTCPVQFTSERSILYANRAAAKVNLENKDGAILDCNKALELNPNYLKALIRRAGLHRKMENVDQSLADYQKILEMDRDNAEARQACLTLPGEINERNEKLKTEMLGKLKDLGNTILRPFGLSTNNFNVIQDPNSGGYSINFQGNQGGR